MSKSTNKPRFVILQNDLRSGYYVHPKGIVVYEYTPVADVLYLTTVINSREFNLRFEELRYPTPREICNLCRKFINEINP